MPSMEVRPPASVGPVDRTSAARRGGAPAAARDAARAGSPADDPAPAAATPRSVAPGVPLATQAGDPPVDATRVAAIRTAIARGTYPLIPTRIADAMIAAGALLRSEQS